LRQTIGAGQRAGSPRAPAVGGSAWVSGWGSWGSVAALERQGGGVGVLWRRRAIRVGTHRRGRWHAASRERKEVKGAQIISKSAYVHPAKKAMLWVTYIRHLYFRFSSPTPHSRQLPRTSTERDEREKPDPSAVPREGNRRPRSADVSSSAASPRSTRLAFVACLLTRLPAACFLRSLLPRLTNQPAAAAL
jgi:hypothetical protein